MHAALSCCGTFALRAFPGALSLPKFCWRSFRPYGPWFSLARTILAGFLWIGYSLGAREAPGGASAYFKHEFVHFSFRTSLGDLVLLASGVLFLLCDPLKLLHPVKQSELLALLRPVEKEQPVWGHDAAILELFFALGLTVFTIVKASMYDWKAQGGGSTTSGLSRSQQFVIVWVIVAAWLGLAFASRFWVPTSMVQLAAAEQRLRQFSGVETVSGLVARVHTIAVGKQLIPSDRISNASLVASPLNVVDGKTLEYGTRAPHHPSNATGAASPLPLVLLHGFGMGAAAYYKTLKGLAPHFSEVYSLDWLGVGLSERPNFPVKGTPEQVAVCMPAVLLQRFPAVGCATCSDGSVVVPVPAPVDVSPAQDWFVVALEEWRIAMGLESFILAGHSLGAIISIAYAAKVLHVLRFSLQLRFPSLAGFNPLCCVSVVATSSSRDHVLRSPLIARECCVTSQHPDHVEQLCLLSPASGRQRPPNAAMAPMFRIARYLWGKGFTPQGLVRWLGPTGPAFVRFIFKFRYGSYSNFTPEELELFSAYTVSLCGPPSHALFLHHSRYCRASPRSVCRVFPSPSACSTTTGHTPALASTP